MHSDYSQLLYPNDLKRFQSLQEHFERIMPSNAAAAQPTPEKKKPTPAVSIPPDIPEQLRPTQRLDGKKRQDRQEKHNISSRIAELQAAMESGNVPEMQRLLGILLPKAQKAEKKGAPLNKANMDVIERAQNKLANILHPRHPDALPKASGITYPEKSHALQSASASGCESFHRKEHKARCRE